ADVAEMLHRRVQPPGGGSPTGGGRRQHHAVASVPRGGTAPPHEPPLDETVEGPVREGPGQRPDAAELAVGGEERAQRPAMGDTFGDERQADVLGQRRFGRGHRSRRYYSAADLPLLR